MIDPFTAGALGGIAQSRADRWIAEHPDEVREIKKTILKMGLRAAEAAFGVEVSHWVHDRM